jgi:hypothetical protein
VFSGLRRSMSGHGAMRPARIVSSKNSPEAPRTAQALFRHCRADDPVAQLIGRRPANHPSRSRLRRSTAIVAFFRASGRGAVGRHASAQWVPLNTYVWDLAGLALEHQQKSEGRDEAAGGVGRGEKAAAGRREDSPRCGGMNTEGEPPAERDFGRHCHIGGQVPGHPKTSQ